MDAAQVEAALGACERALEGGEKIDLEALGFWRAVGAVKRRREWVGRYAERIARIDREAFRRAVPLVFPLGVGVALEVLGTLVGLTLLALSFALPPDAAGVAILLGAGALIGTTHGLTHVAVGMLAGIRFTDFFSTPPRRPQPGFKIDYASYLRASPEARAWMHASGAIASKVVPFLAVPIAMLARAPWWTAGLLIAIGLLSILTDLTLSVRSSDWKRFRREMRVARDLASR